MITLPKLTYPYTALEPYIDEETMRIHHTKHHQGYIDKLNAVLGKYPDLQTESLPSMLTDLSSLPIEDADKTLIRNHGGGHVNHTFFFSVMKPDTSKDQILIKRILKQYESLENFKNEFTQTALNHFGSGWVWLVEDAKNALKLYSTPNQDSPYLTGNMPLLALDIWEHAYYLKYQNRKSEYINNWWNVVKIL
ncbi:MAG: Superoxide dismutase [Microgenomates group bacterium GW2011_GWC1_43_11]|uniref:Superoxide dismutase n=2 Tax=Candidatus Gottesmaniibacteriota TaxID=1752720 RepID=A0A0G1LJH9_9BACT|nr:MAG: Superoxide dismutase [Candidatus Gottesmanbacteria bacterium GW2011_GWA2_42_16]KKS90233.1 MAG: Superoxide dismutase [Microgenomates group bacterium GW2011_GWC1_43_11]KKT36381.1 MAG: Superoxide dismutase [Candidatus Gottesmanbacteria bacterium GW2011_GWB1_44_11c]KKT59979.1 MAG: Superoxide dismutase [Candidatus Gottesmanbacteria bacterium GW2011_GWA1_44_24b]HCM81788.1 superoxide dismutase [Patescibacteria group bacterium]